MITVGATENVRENGVVDGCGQASNDNADDISGFSSRGPTADGRVKPDIMAPGSHISGPASQDPGYNGSGVCNQYYPIGQTLYTWSSGTSHSTPAVAGAAALLHTYYRLNIGGGTPPSPAMLKAFMINGARYLAGAGGSLPSNAQGWGDVYLARAFDTVPKLFFDQTDTFGATGATFVRAGQVAMNAQPFRVTLAWTDAPGSTTSAAYVNNLDLEVTIGGQTYRGNVFSGAGSVPGGAADSRNNVENVFLPAGLSGPFSVKITAANIAGDGVPKNADPTDQDFALVISNGLSSTSGVLRGQVRDSFTPSRPIAGATVGDGTYTATTDLNGNYTLLLPGGSHTVTAAKAGYSPQTIADIAVDDSATTQLDFTLPGGALAGTVTDSISAQPVAGASVAIGAGTTTTDASGRYAIRAPPGDYTVEVAKIGYLSRALDGVTIASGITTTVDVVLTPTLAYAPNVLTRTLNFGQAITDTPGLTLTNYSTVALTATLQELPGGFTPLDAPRDIQEDGIPWLQETPSTVTIPPLASAGVQIGWFAQVPRPGIYTATLQLRGSGAPAQIASIAVTMTVERVAGFILSPTTGLRTSEAGGAATFKVRLSKSPTAPVTIGLHSSDATEGTVTPTELIFSADNWNLPQTATIIGVDDSVDDSDVAYTIVTTLASSADPSYSGRDPPDVSVTNADDDAAGVTIVQSGGGTAVAEGGALDTYTIALDSQPAADVAISFDTGMQIQPIAALIFTPGTWNIPRTVTVRAVDDDLVEGPRAATIAHRASSADPKYDGAVAAIPSVVVEIADNDSTPAPRSAVYLPLIARS